MTLLAASPNPQAAGQIVLATVLAAVGFFLLLPKARVRSVMGGTAALVAAAAILGAHIHRTFGEPASEWVGKFLFILFSSGAVGFGTVLVVQRNPARGAIAFAFVILSTCGLFLLLAAPFLMAATIIIYAGAIIVTFLFVLMLSQVEGPSDENDRTREPLLGALAGFAFVGLILFALQETRDAVAPAPEDVRRRALIPAPILTDDERAKLNAVLTQIEGTDDLLHGDLTTGRSALTGRLGGIQDTLEEVVGESPKKEPREPQRKKGSQPIRLGPIRTDPQAKAALDRATALRELNYQTFHGDKDKKIRGLENILIDQRQPDVGAAKAALRKLRDEVRLLYGMGELPASNVSGIGFLLYADHLLAVELAGALLLVATIGAVAIAHRRGTPQS
jgi:NADH:ubiquinone oxidoreductase subunit 6 (subunit J)